jgi:hypothetical protein
MTAIERQDAFAMLLDSLRSTEPVRKPAATVGLIEGLDKPGRLEIPCQDCAGTGGDGGAIEGWEPCGHCKGSGLEPAPTAQQVERAA